ncbi:helix-turn-helix domain-containing protein [Mycetocola saprophilus]|uniref:helix-turn-helix domain-containing protein n=1 Tax=Mycetocola saprophilus TaxID=76636 RepID=UPI0009DD79EA
MTTHTSTSGGLALKLLRSEAGLTQGEVATLASVAPAYLSKVERGSHAPSPAFVAKVAGAIAGRMAADAVAAPRLRLTA